MYALFETLFLAQRSGREIQFLLIMTQKALEKHSNTLVCLNKQGGEIIFR